MTVMKLSTIKHVARGSCIVLLASVAWCVYGHAWWISEAAIVVHTINVAAWWYLLGLRTAEQRQKLGAVPLARVIN